MATPSASTVVTDHDVATSATSTTDSLACMLSYENQMFLDILSTDGLLVAAKGLGLERVFYSLLRVYSDPGNLVLVMGTSEAEEEHFTRLLEAEPEVKKLPRKVTAECSTGERARVYREGGVLFVTTRILVVDLLVDRLPADLVTGILVYRAHQTAGSCQESFILRLFRQKNRKGFIKAFSSSPVAFKSGYNKIDRVMRNLFLRNLYLWPRFHADVTSTLAERTPDVIELHLEMTPKMMTIQTAVLDLIQFTLSELKRLNPTLEAYDELTVENALSRAFQKLLQQNLDPIWHQLSWKTKQLVADLKTLRTILVYLTQYDCITFHAFVSALRTTENAMRSGGWMILDSAETLFMTSRERVFGAVDDEPAKKKAKSTDGGEEKLDLKFEQNPKWKALDEIIKEIEEDVVKSERKSAIPSEKTLILTSDERTAYQVQDYLSLGSDAILIRMFNKSLGEKHGMIPVPRGLDSELPKAPPVKEFKHKGKGKKSLQSKEDLTLTQVSKNESDKAKRDPVFASSALSVVESPATMIQSSQIGIFELYKLVYELKPRNVIMYDIDMSVVRLLEVFQAANPEHQLRVYFMMFDKSVEEQAYLTTLRKEKEAFEHLIKEKSTMVIPEDREGKVGENQDLVRDSKKASDVIMENRVGNRRAGGQDEQKATKKVIVDMREFRSELPSLIHRRGVDIEPITLEVGDYILTPEICIERKSISDLIGSLQNGRLYNQATSMTRFYAKPMLLIEFDTNKPFALQGKYYMSRDIASSDISARLQLLTIHFPRLKILWSPSPHATAELFEELKEGREEPEASKAAALTMDVVDEYAMDKYNPAIFDFVSRLPGVTTKNVYGILNRVENLADLLNYSLEELAEFLGSKVNGEMLFNALHDRIEPTVTNGKDNKGFGAKNGGDKMGSSGRGGKSGGRFKSKRGRKKDSL